jgi:hypothetical protein
MVSNAMAVTVRVPWVNPYGHGDAWNELLAWTLETYGFTGQRWTFRPNGDYMDFNFPDENDALMFQLKTSGYRVSNEELATELIGSIINGQ